MWSFNQLAGIRAGAEFVKACTDHIRPHFLNLRGRTLRWHLQFVIYCLMVWLFFPPTKY